MCKVSNNWQCHIHRRLIIQISHQGRLCGLLYLHIQHPLDEVGAHAVGILTGSPSSIPMGPPLSWHFALDPLPSLSLLTVSTTTLFALIGHPLLPHSSCSRCLLHFLGLSHCQPIHFNCPELVWVFSRFLDALSNVVTTSILVLLFFLFPRFDFGFDLSDLSPFLSCLRAIPTGSGVWVFSNLIPRMVGLGQFFTYPTYNWRFAILHFHFHFRFLIDCHFRVILYCVLRACKTRPTRTI
jgi:hypothetical protein